VCACTRANVIYMHVQLFAGSRLCIYMEYMPGGSLNKRLESGAFPEKETKRCMTQILEGLSYLHSKHLMHRDVKGYVKVFKFCLNLVW